MGADTDANVSVRGDDVVVYRAMYPEFEGKSYKLEHLFRLKLTGTKLVGQLFVRDDPKDEFAALRPIEGVVISEGELKLDDVPFRLIEAGEVKAEAAPAVAAAVVPKTAPAPALAKASSLGIGYFAQVVRSTESAADLFALRSGISLTRDGQAALDQGEAAFAKGSWAVATAAYDKALGAGVPVSRFAENAARAWLNLKDCAHAERMLGSAQRLDPESTVTVELMRDAAKACPKISSKAKPGKAPKGLKIEQDFGNAPPPRSFDDVSEILRLDEINRFAAAVTFISAEKDVRARALHGQLELAWAEGLSLLAEMNSNLAARLREFAAVSEKKAAADGLSGEEFKELGELRAAGIETAQTAKALESAAAEHLARGLEIAAQVIKANPDNYLGYRVAADSYRLQRDWKAFDKTMAKLAKANPDSNGLLFLKGVAAAQRDRDGVAAAKFLSAALAKDPKFARAQAHLVLIAPGLEEARRELQKLAAISPRHPFVVWTGPALEKLSAPEEH